MVVLVLAVVLVEALLFTSAVAPLSIASLSTTAPPSRGLPPTRTTRRPVTLSKYQNDFGSIKLAIHARASAAAKG
jgi:hypothetical protein